MNKAGSPPEKLTVTETAIVEEIRALKEFLMNREAPKAYLGLEEAARYLHTPAETVRKWIRTKGLPYHKPGRALLFTIQDLDQWMSRYRKGDRGLALRRFVG